MRLSLQYSLNLGAGGGREKNTLVTIRKSTFTLQIQEKDSGKHHITKSIGTLFYCQMLFICLNTRQKLGDFACSHVCHNSHGNP